MRLIDADLLQKVLAKEPMKNRTYLRANEIVVDIPTAYDVDKVCRKINENKDMDNLIDADYAIKIVKSGGIE